MATPAHAGVGLVLWPALMPVLACDCGIGVVEIEPEFSWFETGQPQAPLRVDQGVVRQLAQLPYQRLVHGVAAPLGGSLPPDPARLALMAQVVDQLQPAWASEHLSFNAVCAGGQRVDSGFLLPPLQTVGSAQAAAANLRAMHAALGVPVAVENNVNYLRPMAGEMDDGAWIDTVVRLSGGGLLLDLHNLWTNARNGRQPLQQALAQLPLDRVWELHLAGGAAHRGYWLDAHAGLVDPELLALAAELVPDLPALGAIIFEMLPEHLPRVGIQAVAGQVEQLHRLWARRRPATAGPPAQHDRALASAEPDWRRHESLLSAMVSGHGAADADAGPLHGDPGVALLRELAANARAAQIAGAAGLTTRLLLDQGLFQPVFATYARRQRPQQFASSEALGFLDHVRAQALPVPHLAAVAGFEAALLRSRIDHGTCIVSFDTDPLPLLEALAQRRPVPAALPVRPCTVTLRDGTVQAVTAA